MGMSFVTIQPIASVLAKSECQIEQFKLKLDDSAVSRSEMHLGNAMLVDNNALRGCAVNTHVNTNIRVDGPRRRICPNMSRGYLYNPIHPAGLDSVRQSVDMDLFSHLGCYSHL